MCRLGGGGAECSVLCLRMFYGRKAKECTGWGLRKTLKFRQLVWRFAVFEMNMREREREREREKESAREGERKT